MTAEHHVSASVTTSVVTAFVALWPSEAAVSYIEKLASVLFLAMVAEVGRRAASSLWSRFK